MNGYENIEIVGDDSANPFEDPLEIKKYLDPNTIIVIVGYPDFFGRLFDYTELANACHENGALLCRAVMSCGPTPSADPGSSNSIDP